MCEEASALAPVQCDLLLCRLFSTIDFSCNLRRYTEAAYHLGCLHFKGQGLPKNVAEGVKWVRKVRCVPGNAATPSICACRYYTILP